MAAKPSRLLLVPSIIVQELTSDEQVLVVFDFGVSNIYVKCSCDISCVYIFVCGVYVCGCLCNKVYHPVRVFEEVQDGHSRTLMQEPIQLQSLQNLFPGNFMEKSVHHILFVLCGLRGACDVCHA